MFRVMTEKKDENGKYNIVDFIDFRDYYLAKENHREKQLSEEGDYRVTLIRFDSLAEREISIKVCNPDEGKTPRKRGRKPTLQESQNSAE